MSHFHAQAGSSRRPSACCCRVLHVPRPFLALPHSAASTHSALLLSRERCHGLLAFRSFRGPSFHVAQQQRPGSSPTSRTGPQPRPLAANFAAAVSASSWGRCRCILGSGLHRGWHNKLQYFAVLPYCLQHTVKSLPNQPQKAEHSSCTREGRLCSACFSLCCTAQ